MKKIYLFLGIFCIFCLNLLAEESTFWRNSIKAQGDTLTMYNKGQKIVLVGNSSVKRDDLKVLADKMEIWQKEEKFNGYDKVSTEKFFDDGNFVKADSKKIFYDDKLKITELFDISNLDYYLKKEDKTLNVIADYLKVEEKDGFRDAVFDKVLSMKMPFEEVSSTNVKRGMNFVKADKIKSQSKIDDEMQDYAVFEDNVVVERNYENGEFAKIEAKKMIYSKKDGYVKFEKVREIRAYSLEQNTTYYLYCDELFWKLDDETGYLKGEPVIFKKADETYVITSNSVKIDKKKQEVLFTENPIAKQIDEEGTGLYKAEDILYYLDTEIIKMFGNVDIDFLPKEKKEGKNEDNKKY